MTKTASIKARTDVNLKKEVEIICRELKPNASVQTFKDTDENHNIIECKNADDMFEKLGI